jgi:tetratricopeptide (TPR) repeat protein
VTNLLVSLLGALLATTPPAAITNPMPQPAVAAASVTDTNGPVEKEYRKLLDLDDATQEAVDKLIRENDAFTAQGAPAPESQMRMRIRKHFAPVREAYEDFLKRHPNHARARLAYGSFLNDLQDEEAAHDQWEQARQLDPKNPAAWNNLANYYGHAGPVTNSFDYYTQAIELDPNESVYYHNFGTTVYLFRADAMAHFKITEQQVFQKALDLYAQALRLDATNFTLATDIAQTYYGIKPTRTDEALLAWTYALKLARDDIERGGVYVHLARFKLNDGRFDEARRELDRVTNAMYADLKKRVLRNLNLREAEAKGTNAPPAKVEKETKAGSEPQPAAPNSQPAA